MTSREHTCALPGRWRRLFANIRHGDLWTCATCGRIYCFGWLRGGDGREGWTYVRWLSGLDDRRQRACDGPWTQEDAIALEDEHRDGW